MTDLIEETVRGLTGLGMSDALVSDHHQTTANRSRVCPFPDLHRIEFLSASSNPDACLSVRAVGCIGPGGLDF